MLIITERHTKKDLELWKDYEEIDKIKALSFPEWIEEKAIKAIIEFQNQGPCYIGVSWGKDSIVVADIAMRNNLKISLVHLYCIPSHNPNCDLVRDEFLKLYPLAKYYEEICDYTNIYAQNMPDHLQDKETDKVWDKSWKTVSIKYGANHISGVRGQESSVRNLRMKRWGISTKKTCAPIGYWSTQQVYSYLAKYNLPIHPNYAMLGGGRYNRERLRVAEIGDIHGNGGGRLEWEREYYQDILAKIKIKKMKTITSGLT